MGAMYFLQNTPFYAKSLYIKRENVKTFICNESNYDVFGL